MPGSHLTPIISESLVVAPENETVFKVPQETICIAKVDNTDVDKNTKILSPV